MLQTLLVLVFMFNTTVLRVRYSCHLLLVLNGSRLLSLQINRESQY